MDWMCVNVLIHVCKDYWKQIKVYSWATVVIISHMREDAMQHVNNKYMLPQSAVKRNETFSTQASTMKTEQLNISYSLQGSLQ